MGGSTSCWYAKKLCPIHRREDWKVFKMIQDEVKYRYRKGKSLILSVTVSSKKKKKPHWTENKNVFEFHSLTTGHEFCLLCMFKIVIKTRGKVPS